MSIQQCLTNIFYFISPDNHPRQRWTLMWKWYWITTKVQLFHSMPHFLILMFGVLLTAGVEIRRRPKVSATFPWNNGERLQEDVWPQKAKPYKVFFSFFFFLFFFGGGPWLMLGKSLYGERGEITEVSKSVLIIFVQRTLPWVQRCRKFILW